VQPLQAKIRQYESLGDPETLQQAHGLYQRVVNDPQGFAQALYEAGYAPTMKAAQQQVQQIQNEGSPEQTQNNPLESHPQWQEAQMKIQRMERALGLIAEQQQTRAQKEQEAETQRQLDAMLNEVKKIDPKIDTDFALSMMYANVLDPQMIMQRWDSAIQAYVNAQAAGQPSRAPNLMGAGTNGPIKQDPAQMTQEQRTQALLQHMASQGW